MAMAPYRKQRILYDLGIASRAASLGLPKAWMSKILEPESELIPEDGWHRQRWGSEKARVILKDGVTGNMLYYGMYI